MPNRPFVSSAGSGLFLAVCLILVLQTGASHMLTVDERSIPIPKLHEIPADLGKWRAVAEQSLDKMTLQQLNPDDYILRDYQNAQKEGSINLFIAFFKSLQNTYGPHAPRICLPGAGWLESSAKVTSVMVPGKAGGIPVNQLTYEKSGQRILVLYWYQNDRAIWAQEFEAKFRLLPDLLKYRRSDVSLVRLIAPLRGSMLDAEPSNSVDFAQALFPSLVERLGTVQ